MWPVSCKMFCTCVHFLIIDILATIKHINSNFYLIRSSRLKKIINNILLSTSTNYHPKNSPKTCTKIKLNQTKSTVTLHQAWPASMPLLILCQSWKKFYLLKKQIYLCDFIYISVLQNTWSLGENILASYLSSRNFNLNNITLLYCSL